MKVREIQGNEENDIITGMIVNKNILRAVSKMAKDNPEPFRSRWTNLICKWCLEHLKKFKGPPGSHIQRMFEENLEKDSAYDLVSSYLNQLSGNYQKLEKEQNEQRVIQQAVFHFKMVRYEKMMDELGSALERRDLERADVIYRKGRPPGLETEETNAANPLLLSTLRQAHDRAENDPPLVEFKGDLGKFLNPMLCRGRFICFAGPAKRGKSYWLQEVVWTAIRQRRKVLYYTFGDLTETDVQDRFYARITNRPWKMFEDYKSKATSKLVRIPKSIKTFKDPEGIIKHKVEWDDQNRKFSTIEAGTKIIKGLFRQLAFRQNPLRFECLPSYSVSASDIDSKLDALKEDENFSPDLLVVDYFDLLLEEPGMAKQDLRHRINASWNILRNISKVRNMLVVGATQTAARSLDKWIITQKDFSEDKRKNDIASGMIGINQTSDEKKDGVYRLNWIINRHQAWVDKHCVWTAGNLIVGNPCIRSFL